jgi:hypothetical protein
LTLLNSGKRGADAAAGMMPRFSLQLERRQLSTIHLNAISRIYGDHGEEILELLRKNPIGTIPVILKRLKQKDNEWRKARHELNKNHWKDVIEKNHYKSFDHRSFYFKQNDKKFLSTKPLVQELLTSIANQQLQCQQTATQNGNNASSFSAKEQAADFSSSLSTLALMNRSIQEVGGGDEGGGGMIINNGNGSGNGNSTIGGSHHHGVRFSLPSKEYEDLLSGMNNPPHMILSYPHDYHLVHRDIYRIVCHSSEMSNTCSYNQTDKERLSALWRDLLRIFFNIPISYLYSPSSTASPSASADSTSLLFSSSSDVKHPTITGEAWSNKTKVITIYGTGMVKNFREEDNLYEVELPFGRAFLSPSSILGAEQLSPQALYVSYRLLRILLLFLFPFALLVFHLPSRRLVSQMILKLEKMSFSMV